MTKPRHIELAQFKDPTESERDLITYAKLSDPDPWRVRMLPHAYLRRLKSIQGADRILAHEAAARSAMVYWPEDTRVTFLDWLAALFGKKARASA